VGYYSLFIIHYSLLFFAVRKMMSTKRRGTKAGARYFTPAHVSPIMRRARPRKRKIGRRILLCGMLVGAAVFGFQKAYSMATHLSLFRLREVAIRGNRVVSEDRIRSLAQLVVERNIFEADLAEAATRILREPMVKAVRLSRKLPDRIEISIKEREPIALLARERLYGVDRERVLLPSFPPDSMPDLPIFTSIGRDTTKPGGVLQSVRLKEGIELLDEIRKRDPGLITVISEIHLGSREGLTLYLINGGMNVKWGRGDFGRKIATLRAALNQIPSTRRFPRVLDMRFEGQVVARF